MACVVHVGDFLARAFEYGSGGDDNVPALEEKALALLKLDMKGLESVMDNLGDKFLEVSDISFD